MTKEPKALDKVAKVSSQQVEFGREIGLELNGCTQKVAEAMIYDLIDTKFYGIEDFGSPSEKQCNVAADFGFDITQTTKRVGSAIVDDIFDQLNRESIENQQLKQGDVVIKRWSKDMKQYVISSIQEDGSVYFKGGNMNRAWARNVVKIS